MLQIREEFPADRAQTKKENQRRRSKHHRSPSDLIWNSTWNSPFFPSGSSKVILRQRIPAPDSQGEVVREVIREKFSEAEIAMLHC